MKIAQVAPLYEAVPPKLYGGTERIVSFLTEALVELGHEVTLYASGDSETRAKLVPSCSRALRLNPAPCRCDIAAHLAMLQRVKKQADEFDLIHFHTDLFHLPVFEEMAANTITTLHGRLDLEALPELYRRWPMYPLVSISDSQRKPLKNAFWSATIYHGIGGDRLALTPIPRGKYVAFLGRIAPEKGSDRAIRIAQAAGVPLKIAAKVGRDDEDYFCGAIRPMLRMGETEFIGEIGEKQKAEFLGNAAALLFPIDWPEPFGLVMIEAMACGTPVIAWNCGSVPEIIEDGVTGFIVSDEIAAARAIARAARLDRKQIREAFEKRFTAKRMAEEYVRLYETILWRPGMPRAQFSAIPRANTPTWGFEREETLSCLQVPVSGAEGAI